MELVRIYQCFCDVTRLRILHLLMEGPLCVCHFQSVLDLPQTKISRHLAYLRKHAIVETSRQGTWIIYSLPAKPSPALDANLKALEECVAGDQLFAEDLQRVTRLKEGASVAGGAFIGC